jgi:predicted nucleotidyltransferase
MERIRELAGRIAREFRPEKIVLFGSHARGDAGKYSDVDLLVVLSFEGSNLSKQAEIRSRVRQDFGIHVVARTPEDMERRLALGDFFLMEAVEEGKVLYESPRARVG